MVVDQKFDMIVSLIVFLQKHGFVDFVDTIIVVDYYSLVNRYRQALMDGQK
ncbi:hypothetical protein [Microseira sp. BLCC-F43]|uniref:hypothetical protein n=1 Tax=Microseira sp. BLCC-F43 TaxID=3153602 RepID=UPI0035B96EAF